MKKMAASVLAWNDKMMKKIFIKSGLQIALTFGCFLFVWACNQNSNPGINASTSTIGYVLANGTNTTIFNSAVVKAGLDSVFNSPSIFTLFVPNNDACTQSGYSQDVINAFTHDQARAWVLYQTYAGTALTLESFIGKTEEKLIMADGDSIFVTGDSNRTYVNGFQMYNSEVTATNGQMLALQNALSPPTQNLAQIVSSDTSLSFLNQAITLATPVPDSLSTLLSTGGPFTFLAPDNDAFRNLGFTSPTDLSAVNPDSLRSMILLGLIPQRLFGYDVADSSTYKTVNDSTLVFYYKGLANSVQVLGSDTTSNVISISAMAINGVLFKIDAVLAP
jgi:uncharacterized surface protein with fasciclin (FAS1) repeats